MRNIKRNPLFDFSRYLFKAIKPEENKPRRPLLQMFYVSFTSLMPKIVYMHALVCFLNKTKDVVKLTV